VVADDCIAHFAFFHFAFLRLSILDHLHFQRLYGLTLFCLCSDLSRIDFAELNTTKWHRKSAIIPSRGRALHRQLLATTMADPSQL
jgi:hypothetical protein